MNAVDRFAQETRESVLQHINYRAEEIARRDNLDLKNPTDLVTAQCRVLNEDPQLCDLYRRAFSVPVREASLME